jgi:hypothetical protein
VRPSSAKNKGRRFQQFVKDTILKYFPTLEEDDVRSTSMGAPGEDILLSPAARRLFPYTVECKNVEKLNIWEAIRQARSFGQKHTEIVVFKKNQEIPYVALPLDKFMELVVEKSKNSLNNS